MVEEQNWSLYLIQCADGTLYTGIARGLEKRIATHNDGSGARYTRGRGPVTLVYREDFPDRATASKREYEVKRMTRREKLKLIESHAK
ncbi:MAG: GIY-YIG nuclease family protein [Proteobacteria bacterium]|nr:GIY-YIG nuclease family protein [Pseudomonadota bacterium]MBU1688940.1 GIY-YIG nuclease family protein [Pseudomonadota bacterium]